MAGRNNFDSMGETLGMSYSFNERITEWQLFFATVATVSATLAGLLFVSLSINRDRLLDSDHGLLRVARRSFMDFLYILLISLMFLIPQQGSGPLSRELLLLGLARIWRLAVLHRESRGKGWKPTFGQSIREYALPTLTVVGLVGAGVWIARDSLLAVYYFIVPVIALLLWNASWNAWLLLLMEKSEGQK